MPAPRPAKPGLTNHNCPTFSGGCLRRAQEKADKRLGALTEAREERQHAIQQALDSGETLATIGRVLGVTRQRVNQLVEGQSL